MTQPPPRSDAAGEPAILSQLGLLLRDIRARFGLRAWGLLLVMALNGLMEGVGFVLLLPLLNAMGIGDPDASGRVGTALRELFAALTLPPTPGTILAIIIGVFFVQNAVFLGQGYLASALLTRYVALWREALFAACIRAGWPFFLDQKPGNLSNALVGETSRLEAAFYSLNQLAASLVTGLVYALLAVLVSWQVTTGLLLISGLLFLALRGTMRLGYAGGRAYGHHTGRLQGVAQELLGGARFIKSSATEESALAQFRDVVETLRRVQRRLAFLPTVQRAVFEFTLISALCAFLALGVDRLGLDAGALFVVLALFVRLYPRLATLQQHHQNLMFALPAIGHVTAPLEQARRAAEVLDDSPLPPTWAGRPVGVELRGLHCAHGATPILQDLTLSIPPGALVGIVGPSGAGKSTLADCLMGLIPLQAGRIDINGRDLRTLPMRSWRRVVGYVIQEAFLFHGTIAHNILWGVPNPTSTILEAAARQARALDFIQGQPRGFETPVGERGSLLSGGQRQRISLARALASQPSLLILDEATSALDADAERQVLEAIHACRGRLTVLIITHRLGAVRQADAIHVLEEGRIVESGTWDELLAREGGRFARLHALQGQGRSAPEA
ncbi:MAG: ABC transporter ATP-binding protein [Magnetococcales bacterium]|nr:ABC transporter ATP-binding protein [Magnetococcales bacterium]